MYDVRDSFENYISISLFYDKVKIEEFFQLNFEFGRLQCKVPRNENLDSISIFYWLLGKFLIFFFKRKSFKKMRL